VGTPKPLATFVAMGFVRGEQFVELIANDPSVAGGKALNFFLFRFQSACNSQPGGCTNGDLLTPAIEKGFTGYTLYEDLDINNTIFDCQQCHQANGPAGQKALRMQELQNPWGHFFRNNRSNGLALFDDYGLAHGPAGFTTMTAYLTDQNGGKPTLVPSTAEAYAGIPGAVIFNSNTTNNNGAQTAGGGPDPAALEGLVENQGFQQQPNEFISGRFLDKDPAVSGWMTIFNNVLIGADIPVPFYNTKVSDPTKITAMTSAYVSVMKGTTPSSTLPDIRDAFLDTALPSMTFRPAASLITNSDGKGIMVQMCQQCHNPLLDQTISRAKFDVTKLSTMPADEKQKAILRINLPQDSFRRMPPPRFRTLSPSEIALVTTELMK
jgi:mono/diheme cytochrome c family protein